MPVCKIHSYLSSVLVSTNYDRDTAFSLESIFLTTDENKVDETGSTD